MKLISLRRPRGAVSVETGESNITRLSAVNSKLGNKWKGVG